MTTNDAFVNISSLSGGVSSYTYKWYAYGSDTIISTSNAATKLVPDDYMVSISSGVCSANFTAVILPTG